MTPPTIICFGEVLWDKLPTGKIAGGAPMNVAYHANNFGLKSKMISRVGNDELGRELLSFLKEKGVATDLIQIDHTFPTGVVNVTLDEKGSPSYEIVEPSAWDYIHPDEAAQKAVKNAAALVFGSLACRTERTKKTLLELLGIATFRVFDVNLRAPFYSQELLETLLAKADFVKMNDDELDIISGWFNGQGSEQARLQLVREKFDIQSIVMTKGPNGAVLLNDSGFFQQGGFKVKVQDTIGSGDSFLAAFLKKLLTDAPPQECLAFACATGALVASKKGGTPATSEEEVDTLREKV
jgi:fructokinase